jgi:hypothetical protein
MKLIFLSLLCPATSFLTLQTQQQRTAPSSAPNLSCIISKEKQTTPFAKQSLSNDRLIGSPLYMFGGLFGGDGKAKNEEDRELAVYPKLASSDVKFNSLSDYIQTWSQLFVTDPKGMRLTTPVQVLPTSLEQPDDKNVVAANGVRLVFKSTATGYQSKTEQDSTGGYGYKKPVNDNAEPATKKKEEKKEGGVEILVEQLANGEVRVTAKRCEIDENTMIKEMSEEAIVNELKKAIDAWKKVQ